MVFRSRKKGTRAFNVQIPTELYEVLKKLAVDHGFTMKEIFIQYLEFLEKKPPKQREVLNEKSNTDFKLDDGES